MPQWEGCSSGRMDDKVRTQGTNREKKRSKVRTVTHGRTFSKACTGDKGDKRQR
jgi:hypothetical protein